MKPKELTPGEALRSIVKKHKMRQMDLAEQAQCSPSMLCMILKDQRSPGYELSSRIMAQFPFSARQRELMSWYLTKQHHKLEKLKHDFPNTFEDLRTSWLREDEKSS